MFVSARACVYTLVFVRLADVMRTDLYRFMRPEILIDPLSGPDAVCVVSKLVVDIFYVCLLLAYADEYRAAGSIAHCLYVLL